VVISRQAPHHFLLASPCTVTVTPEASPSGATASPSPPLTASPSAVLTFGSLSATRPVPGVAHFYTTASGLQFCMVNDTAADLPFCVVNDSTGAASSSRVASKVRRGPDKAGAVVG
jgi:hypothetical protein